MTYLVPAAAFGQDLDEAERLLAQFGDVTSRMEGKARVRLSFVVDAPGYGLPKEAELEFVEWYHRTAQGWLRERYVFEYRPVGSRRAHHFGQPGLEAAHQHCEPPGQRSDAHYADYERLLRPAAEELGSLLASREPIDCRGLRTL